MVARPALALTVALIAPPAPARGNADADVQWSLLSHAPAADRRPLCPVDREPFAVLFQAAATDLTAARVGIDPGADGGPITWIDAQLHSIRGPVAIWHAQLPASTTDRLSYVIEAIDGPDRDYLSAAGVTDDLPNTTDWWTLDFQTLSHAPLGATPGVDGTVFRVWAPGAASAHVRGTFNGWSLGNPMHRVGSDFLARVPGAQPNDRYKYFFNNALWKPDARGRFLNNLQNFDTTVIDPLAYEWAHPDFSPAPPEQWVVYQLHVGTFAGRNDPAGPTPAISRFRDVTARVAHLAELGVNAVMLNPINEFPGEKSGGYNSISAFAFETSYGSPDELRAMVDALHGAGIAVVLDTVWNHFPSGDNFLWNYDGTQHYFDTPAVGTPWGPQADTDRTEVRDYYLASVETVMGEYRIDGYRHDAIYELVSNSQWAGGQQLVRDSMALLRSRFPDTHVIGEIYNNSAWNTSPSGIDLDGQYHEAYKNAIKDAVDAAAFGDPDISRLAAAIDGSGPYVEADRVFNYFELHDEAWPLSGAGRSRAVKRIDTTFPHDDRYALGRTKLANALTILAQGMPAMLMGTEWADDADWEFEKLDWSKRTRYAPVFEFYQDLISLRTSKPALFANSPANVFHVNDGANVVAFDRWSAADGRSYVVLANFSNTDFTEYLIGLPRPGNWGVLINSEDSCYGGTGFGPKPTRLTAEPIARDGFPQRASFRLPAHGLLLLQHEPEFLSPPADLTGDGQVDSGDLQAFIVAFLALSPIADLTNDGQVDSGDLGTFITLFLQGC